MPVLQDSARAGVAAHAGAAFPAAVVLGGCLGSGGGEAPSEGPAARLAPVRLANCKDWKKAGPSERDALVDAVREFAGGPTGSPAGRGLTIPDERAYKLFESYCKRDFARGFKLYKLYGRAAAFGQR